MKYLGIYLLVILVSVEFVSTQCTDGTCDCHCTCCRFCTYPRDSYCEFCQAGWGGTINNRCQRKNLAYEATAISSSTSKEKVATNAVDEDPWTYALTETEKYPRLTINLSNTFTTKGIYLILQEDRSIWFFVYITKSTQTELTDVTLCNFFYGSGNKYLRNLICTKTLTGDQIVITTNSTNGRLVVYETQVYECSQGTYGERCDLQCKNCIDNKCEQYTGVCSIGCKSNLYGNKCDRQCPSQCGSTCDRSLGCTNCWIGYNGPNCYPCDRNTYGKNCSLTCQNCDDCNNVNGCVECRNGFYGYLCNLECPKQCRNDICYRQSGVCKDGCKDGHAGTKCETPCKENCATCETDNLCISCVTGRFGTNCEYLCPGTCGGSNTCDKNSGVCSECNPGTFGPNCTQQCSNNCLTGIPSVCDRNGTCISGCMDGWFGPHCDTLCPTENCEKCNSSDFSCEICNIGYYLDNVQEIRKCVKCPSKYVSCNSDLRCTECIPKFTGYQCENECTINCVDDLFKYNIMTVERSDIACNAENIEVFLPQSLIHTTSSMTWLDPNCSIAFNGTHFISKILHDQCGTTVGLTQSNVIFENKIIVHPFKTENPVLDFGTTPTEISVKCIYPRAEMTMSSYQPVKQQVRVYEKRFGHLDIDMRQYETNQFKHALNDLSTPRKLELSSDIFISVGLPTGDTSGLGVHLDTCTATKTSTPYDNVFITLIENGCSKVNFVHFLPSPANEVRFSLKTFQFTSSQSNVVYIHCQAVVCLANSSQCSTDCSSRRTKRDVSSDTSHLLSMGPLMFVTKRASSNVVANIIAGVSATVAMVAVVYAALSRRRINPVQFKDNRKDNDKTNF